MFKKSLLAMAMASASMGAFAAADIVTNSDATRSLSIEGATSLTNANAGMIQIDMDAEYSVGDIITLSFTGADFANTGAPTSINPTLADTNDSMTLGLLSSTATTLTYRVTELNYVAPNTTDTTIGGNFQIAADTLAFSASDIVTNGAVSVTFAAKTSTNFDLDTPASSATGTLTLIEADTQFASTVTSLDATIDVNTNRLTFTGNAVQDVLTVATSDSGTVDWEATLTGITYELTGDFAFLDTDADTDGIQTTKVTGNGGTTVDSVEADKITFSRADNAADAILTIDVSDSGNTEAASALEEQTFTLTTTVAFTDHGTDADPTNVTGAVAGTKDTVAEGTSAGSWLLNGSVVKVPYLAYGPNTKSILRHTNYSSQTGDITLRYMVEDVDTAWQDAGVIIEGATPGVRNLKDAVDAALLAAGYNPEEGGFKVALEITTNVPTGEVTVFAANNVKNSADDRLTVGAFN